MTSEQALGIARRELGEYLTRAAFEVDAKFVANPVAEFPVFYARRNVPFWALYLPGPGLILGPSRYLIIYADTGEVRWASIGE